MQWHSVNEAAAILGISPMLVYRLCAAGRLAHRRLGLVKGRGKIQVSDENIETYLKSCEIQTKPETPVAPQKAKVKRPTTSERPDGKPLRDIWFKNRRSI